MGDPRAACFHARFALESAVHWLYRHENSLRKPYDQSLGALLHEPTFQNLLPESVFQKARVIQQVGNQAVHDARPIREFDARQSVKELHHLCYWITRTYAPHALSKVIAWSEQRIPKPVSAAEVVPRKELATLEKQLAEQQETTFKHQQERDALDAELQALRAQLTETRAASEQLPDTHDYSEAETRTYLIDVDLHRAGWALNQPRDREYEVTGMPNAQGIGYADYVLWGDDGKPLAVVEAKRATGEAHAGQQQAKLYADCLEQMHGQRPIIFYTNGYDTWLWDDTVYPPREVAGFYKKDELARLILRRTQRKALDVTDIKSDIADRYYQKRVIGSIAEQFATSRRKALLVMATGTGKTRTAIALVDLLQRAGWARRVLFLADRVSLVNQAVNAFKKHLPESSPVNLVTEKNTEGRVYACTYPTMMGLIDESDGGTARFGVGHFDLVIIDEAHRSVYQRYRAIFRYFDSLLVGLTATPRDEVDRNTYELFDLEVGVPTDSYELNKAVDDGYLVPYQAEKVALRFQREGIHYDQLSKEEQAEWESMDWGDRVEEAQSGEVNAPAINNWLFNQDTVDKVLQHLMAHGHKVEGGDRLAKTILFARNHGHAIFIEKRFNHHYPQYKGQFARVIDHQANYPQSLIDDFSQKDKVPHIAISVDMLDTGIDIQEVANLVFFKPVYSKIKFWQMIGRGTRLCPDLFGPGEDKADFRIFDFCFNFDFFRENADGIVSNGSLALGLRLFRARVQLLRQVQTATELDADSKLKTTLADGLHAEVAAMNRDNFFVNMHWQAVEAFQKRTAWENLSEANRETLSKEVARLPSQIETDVLDARLFDLIALRMQLALVEGDRNVFLARQRRVTEIAMQLEEKAAVPQVKAQLAYLAAIQDSGFWEGMDLTTLEDMRLRLRVLVQFINDQKRAPVYSNFRDEVMGVAQEQAFYGPKMTGVQYEKKVRDYLRNHQDHLVIHRLRANQPLTPTDLEGLEKSLVEIGEDEGETLLSNLLTRSEASSLVHFVRSMVGMDRRTAHAAFAQFLEDRSLTSQQIRFIEMVIEQLTARGVMEPAALFKPPFSNLHSAGPTALFVGKENVIQGIFEALDTMQPSTDERQQA